MEFNALLRARHNVYGFQTSKDVPDELLNKILENALHVPSAGFTQDFDFIVVKDRSKIERLASASYQEEYNKVEGMTKNFLSTAPVLVIPCADKIRYSEKYGDPESKENARLPWWLIDSGFASFALLLSAYQEGLAASFIGVLEDDKVASILELPKDGSIIPLAIIPIGYPDLNAIKFETNIRRKSIKSHRKKSEEMIHKEKW
jgi:nitroreductase